MRPLHRRPRCRSARRDTLSSAAPLTREFPQLTASICAALENQSERVGVLAKQERPQISEP